MVRACRPPYGSGRARWADEGLLKAWYPRGVSTAEKRLRYYAERFDVVEVDSPYYALPDPAVTERWARRTPDDFTFHVKASAAMTWHEGEPTDEAFRLFRAALEPLELSGKLRGVLLQYHPRFTKSEAAKAELARAPERVSRRSSRSSSSAIARGSTSRSGPRRSRSSRRTSSPTSRSTARAPAPPTCRHASRRRPTASPTCASTAGTRRRGTSVARRPPPSASTGSTAPRSLPSGSGGSRASPTRRRRSTRSSTTTATTSRRGARQILRGLLDEAGVPAAGGIEPEPRELRLF